MSKTTRQIQDEATAAAFTAAMTGRNVTPSARQIRERETGLAFGAAMRSGKARANNPAAPKTTPGCKPTARAIRDRATGDAWSRAVAASPKTLQRLARERKTAEARARLAGTRLIRAGRTVNL